MTNSPAIGWLRQVCLNCFQTMAHVWVFCFIHCTFPHHLLQFIESYFGEDGSAYSEEIKQMDQLRAVSVRWQSHLCAQQAYWYDN